MNKNLRKICALGILTALYVVLGFSYKIPLIGHIATDLGYVVFAVALYNFGVAGAAVGILGCFLESLVLQGWIPYGWIVGQLLIGIVCGLVYTKCGAKSLQVLVTIVAMFVGIGLIKTLIECRMFGIPFEVKFMKNLVAFVADLVPMLIGLVISWKMVKRET